jgi:glycosyltransferase involved in cell wall biosynthesis
VSFFCALWYRWRYQVRVVYCVALPEKLVFTPFARLFGMRVIWAQHRHPSPKLKSWLVRLVYRRSGRMATIVCVSRSVAQDVLAMGIPRQRTRVIHPGIDLDTVAAIAPEQIMYFQKKFVIGSMSRLRPGKGIEYLLQAFAAVRETVPDAQLVILGEGEHRQQLEWLAQRLGVSPAVHFAGFVPDFYPWLLGMDVYVLPPVEPEAAGLSVLQAMASGAAVVATDVGGLSEIIVPGETGVLVPPADVDALVEALLSLYHHRAEREEMTQLARRSVITRYTASRMLEEYREVLEG